ncbi:MAG: DUF4254 domain-containing protein [Betaproteobacteria bacterium]|nr:DUF4254 domain-containing protein [Betaproteobacteria bacterium]
MSAPELPKAADIIALHDYALAAPGQPARFPHGVWAAIEGNHWHNGALWEQEDLARRKTVPDSDIASNKRAIDAHNQRRNDAVERIDEELLKALAAVKRKESARHHSETAGAMIDRLSILALKIHHMRLQTERKDAGPEHVAACKAKLAVLEEQRRDLAACLDRLLAEAARGESFFKVYRQYKMYNDPKLNPAMYNEPGARR